MYISAQQGAIGIPAELACRDKDRIDNTSSPT